MRIFVYNCNTYIGKALVKELRKHDESNYNRIFGCQTAAGGAPPTVKRLLTRDDPKKAMKMETAIRSSSVVVLDLFNCTEKDLHFVLQALKVDPKSNPPRRTGDIEDKDGNKKDSMTFILVSSAMVWANTELKNIVVPAAGEPADGEAPPDGEGEPAPPAGPPSAFSESFFDQRVPTPGSRYEQWRDMENLVRQCFSLEGSQVRAFTVGAGVLYGDGEETFTQLFKDAWLGTETHKIAAPGTNVIPTCHVRDVARLVRAVCYNPELSPETRPYFLAVDKIDEDAPTPTQAEIVKGIVGEVSGPRDIPLIEPPPPPKPAQDGEEAAAAVDLADATLEPGSAEALAEAMTLNLKMEPSSLMLEEGFEWHCRGGLLKNMRMVAEEFSKERELRAMRVIIAGPPASGKKTLCQAVSDHFNIPLLAVNLEDLDATRAQLMSEVCRYRGYVLNAGYAGYDEVEQLFCKDYPIPIDPDAEEEPPPPPADDGEEGEPAPPPPPKTERRLSEEGIVPAFAVMLQAPEGTCRARYTNAGKGDVIKFKGSMDQFANRNLTDGQNNFADFFQDIAKIGVFNLPIAMKSEEDMFESTRIYMENGGRPFNYLKSADEVHEEMLAAQQEKDEIAAKMSEVAERQVSVAKDKNEADNKRHLERLRIIGAHESEKGQLEALPLREYLMRYMVPNLTEGLIEMCRVMPENPTDYLANYLEEHAANERVEN